MTAVNIKALTNKETAVGKGIRTAYQSLVGLVIAIWAVPGVSEVVIEHAWQFVALVVPAGVVSWLQNKFNK